MRGAQIASNQVVRSSTRAARPAIIETKRVTKKGGRGGRIASLTEVVEDTARAVGLASGYDNAGRAVGFACHPDAVAREECQQHRQDEYHDEGN